MITRMQAFANEGINQFLREHVGSEFLSEDGSTSRLTWEVDWDAERISFELLPLAFPHSCLASLRWSTTLEEAFYWDGHGNPWPMDIAENHYSDGSLGPLRVTATHILNDAFFRAFPDVEVRKLYLNPEVPTQYRKA